MKPKVIIAIVCVVAIGIAAGALIGMKAGQKSVPEVEVEDTAKEEEEVTVTKEDKVEEEPKEETKKTAASDLKSLLTNEPVADEALVKNRPVAFMFENTKEALPHYGLSKAGIVYECPVEGGITRIMAVYDDYSGMDKIGCVRSARPYYAYFAKEYDAIFVHYGQSVHTESLLKSKSGSLVEDINGLDGAVSSSFYRDNSRKAPHNAFSSSDGIDRGIKNKGYQREFHKGYENGHFKFAKEENTLSEGEDCAVLTTYFRLDKPYFIYDESTKLYNRYEFGAAHKDAMNNQQLAFTNIIYEYAPSSLYGDTKAGYLNIPLKGSGKGKFFTNGKMVDITWKKDSDTSATRYYYTNGDEIELNTGKTMICLIENSYVDSNQYYETVSDFKK